MKDLANHREAAAWTVRAGARVTLVLLGIALAFPAGAQGVNFLWLTKDRAYVQSSAGVVGTERHQFTSTLGGNAALSGIAAPVVSGPVNAALIGAPWNGGRMVLSSQGPFSVWNLFNGSVPFTTSTQADLDARFGSGTYTIAVNGVNVVLNLSGDAYPNVPQLTLAGGEWSGGVYVVDPSRPFSIATNAFAGRAARPGSTVHVYVGYNGANVADGWESSADSLFVTVPANTLVEGRNYYAAAVFSAVVDTNTTAFPGAAITASYRTITNLVVKAQAPPQKFPMTVTSNITPTVATATASFQPRPQDVGTTASVFVFALAPAARVAGSVVQKSARFGAFEKGEKDTAAACVLAQLNASGQLQAVSASSMQAYASGVLTGQSQAVSILNGVATANIGGSTFFLGYGPSAAQMLGSGVNQRAVSVAGNPGCDPKPPQTGWWWNTNEGGRGYSIEAAGEHLFFASYLYDASGRATWYVASGNTSLDGSLFTGNLEAYSSGQTLAGVYRAPSPASPSGAITLAFNDPSRGTMIWPGGSVAIERFNIVPGGLTMPSRPNQPEAGWWWNPEESGRGFFLEWQGGQLFMTGFMFDDAGNPIWYLSQDTSPATNPRSYSGVWWQYGNGQTLTGPYRAPTRVNDNVAPVTIQFSGPETGIMTLPNGRTTAIRRFRF